MDIRSRKNQQSDFEHSDKVRAAFDVAARAKFNTQTQSGAIQKIIKKKRCTDFAAIKREQEFFTYDQVRKNRHNVSQTILGKDTRSKRIVTEDSRLYVSQADKYSRTFRKCRIDARKKIDSLNARHEQHFSKNEQLYIALNTKFLNLREKSFDVSDTKEVRSYDLSPVRMWQMSMACAMVFGMVTMSLIFHNLGQSVQAGSSDAHLIMTKDSMNTVVEARDPESFSGLRLPLDGKAQESVESDQQAIEDGEGTTSEGKMIYSAEELEEQKALEQKRIADDLQRQSQEADAQEAQAQKERQDQQQIDQEQAREDAQQQAFESAAREMVAGYPIENMLDAIFEQDRDVASYLIAIAKQESAWGQRVPVLDGEDCYNYWGYRKQTDRMGSGGHTCFYTPQEAVEVVGKRLYTLVHDQGRSTPREMLVWKCGSSCATHDIEGVNRWVATVTQYKDALQIS